MDRKVRQLKVSELRQMIKEEAAALAKGDPEDVKAKETPWEEEEGVNDVDWLKAGKVKSEGTYRSLRQLKLEAARLARQLRETNGLIKRRQERLQEARARSRRSR